MYCIACGWPLASWCQGEQAVRRCLPAATVGESDIGDLLSTSYLTAQAQNQARVYNCKECMTRVQMKQGLTTVQTEQGVTADGAVYNCK